MDNLNEILGKEYGKKTATTSLLRMIEDTLDEVYEKAIEGPEVLTEAPRVSRAKQFVLSLPKFTPSEAWGDPNSIERKQINRLFSVMGGGYSIEGKLRFLQRITEPNTRITSPRRIISSLILLESLGAVVNSFNAASAGFVFEGFLAALLKGEQEADVSAKGNLPIQDLIAFSETDSPVPISLKLLRVGGHIEGSFTNLIDGLDEFGQMIYIVARKDAGSLAIEQFTFDQSNFIDALTLNARGKLKSKAALFRLDGMTPEESIRYLKGEEVNHNGEVIRLPVGDWSVLYDVLQTTAGYSERVARKRAMAKDSSEGGLDKDENTPLEEAIRQEWTQIAESASGDGGTQWVISAKQLPTFSFIDYKRLGSLPYQPESILRVAEMHMHNLNAELGELFAATQQLSENINRYFTVDARSKAVVSAERGIQNSLVIQNVLTTQLNDDTISSEQEVE